MTYESENAHGYTVTVETEAVWMDDILEDVRRFLLAVGYSPKTLLMDVGEDELVVDAKDYRALIEGKA
jgi:hypothetical protein